MRYPFLYISPTAEISLKFDLLFLIPQILDFSSHLFILKIFTPEESACLTDIIKKWLVVIWTAHMKLQSFNWYVAYKTSLTLTVYWNTRPNVPSQLVITEILIEEDSECCGEFRECHAPCILKASISPVSYLSRFSHLYVMSATISEWKRCSVRLCL